MSKLIGYSIAAVSGVVLLGFVLRPIIFLLQILLAIHSMI